MSDTPETDAIADFYLTKAFSKDPADRTVPCQFAARLERDLNRTIRERDEALHAIHTYKCETEAWELLQEARRERDEARTTIEDAKRALNATDYEGILLAAMRVKEERDEARQENAICREAIESAVEFVKCCIEAVDSDSTQGAGRATLRQLAEAVGKACPRLLYEKSEGQNLYGLRYRELVRERDEARAVAGAMADIAFKHLTSLLASTPHSKDAAHDEETQEVIAAIKQWKELKQ